MPASIDDLAQLLSGIKHVRGPKRFALGLEDVAVVCLVRDGAEYIRPFLDHYRRLGAAHVVLLDHGSTDGTAELAAAFSGVTVLRAETARLGPLETEARRYLVDRYCSGGWCLLADMDEFFDYPGSQERPLPELARYLAERSYTAAVAQMLDLFSDRPLDRLEGELERERHAFYDLSEVEALDYFAVGRLVSGNVLGHPGTRFLRGGVRRSLFGSANWLTKHPLFLPKRAEMTGLHTVRAARCADFTAALLHYKFTGSFFRRTRDYVRRGFGVGHDEYQAVLRRGEDPRLLLGRPAARRLSGLAALLAEGFLVASPAYRRWAGAS